MKRILYSIIVAGLAFASAACQKLDEQIITPGATSNLVVTADIVNFDGTRVSYAFSEDSDPKSGIKPSWEEGDMIFGFDENGNTFSFTIPENGIDEAGKATFDASGATGLSGTLYAVYYPGKSADDFDGKTLEVDLSNQSGSLASGAPAIMCATGTIKDDKVNFSFTNQTAIVGIYKMQVYDDGQPVGAGKSVTGVTLKGATVDGTIMVKDGVLTLEAGETQSDLAASVVLTTDGEGYVNVDTDAIAPYFSVIPAENAELAIEATCGGATCKTNASISGKINAGSYYYLGKKIYSGTVATIGATGYATVSEAFAAAGDGDEIVLRNSCMVDRKVLVDKELTLDLNGNILTQDGTKRIGVGEGGKLTVRDNGTEGTIDQAAPGSSVFSVSEGELNIYGGTISKGEESETNTIVVSGSGVLNVYGGTITNARKSAIYISGGEVTFDESSTGVVRGINNAIAAEGGTLTIEGGCFAGNGINNYAAVYKMGDDVSIEISGGCYSKAPVDGLLKNGYESAKNTDQDTKDEYPYIVKEYNEVATLTVGGGEPRGFSSVEAAVAEANKEENRETECMIILTAPSTIAAEATIINKAGVTLNLNDQTLTFGGDERIYVGTGASLTITDGTDGTGKIIQSSAESNALSLSRGTLTIDGGTITSVEESTVATVYVTGGTLTMNGGEITGAKVGISMPSEGSGTVIVNNGKVTSTTSNGIVASAGNLTITGGYFAGKGTGTSGLAAIYKKEETTSTVEISGGYYSKAPADGLLATTPVKYVCVANDDDETKAAYPIKVVEFSAVATFTVGGTTTEFASVEGAVAEANNADQACTITLTASSTVGKAASVTNSYGVTLDLNGYTLTHVGSNRLGVKNSGKLIIDDTQTGGTIIQTTLGSSTITYSSGELIVNGGTITKAAGSTYSTLNVSGGKLTVNGGTITNDAKNNSDGQRAAINVSGASTRVDITGGTIESSGWRALYIADGTVNITGGTISASFSGQSDYANAIYINGGTVNINGENVNITQPKLNYNKAAVPAVYLMSGSLTLDEGTIGGTSTGDNVGNFTAVRIVNGTFTMNGGSLIAQRHAIYFSNPSAGAATGSATVTGGELRNTVYSSTGTKNCLFRFDANAAHTFKIEGGHCYSRYSAVMFATARNTALTFNVSATISGGYFNEDISAQTYASHITIDGTVTSASETVSDRQYNYQVTK